MTYLLLASISIRITALILSVLLQRKIHDWRMGFITVVIGLAVLRPIFILLDIGEKIFVRRNLFAAEIPSFIVGALTLLAVFFLWRVLDDRKRTEERLKVSEERWRSLVQNAPDIILTVNQQGQIQFINYTVQGFSVEEVMGTSLFDYVPETHHGIIRKSLQQVFKKGEPQIFEIQSPRKRGQLGYWSARIGPIKQDGKVIAAVLITTDISERREAEEALKQSEERYRRFFQEDLTGDYVSTPEGQILACNPAFARIFGFSSVEEVLAWNARQFYPSSEDRNRFLNELKEKKKLENYENELRARDGKPVYVIANITGDFDEEGNLKEIRGYIFDNTERKLLEDQLRHSQKMEAIGRLAGGIAHDFNNLLTVILSNADLLLKKFNHNSEIQQEIEGIKKEGERAASLIRQLLTFSRKQVTQEKIVNINEILQGMEGMLRRLLREDINLTQTRTPDIGLVKADPTQLQQVILNLIVNAVDAMPDGGQLFIETSNISIKHSQLHSLAQLPPGKYVRIAVTDTGIGMDAEIQSQIFEPFFTTKPLGKGTGLGLSTVYAIVEQCKGGILVESQKDIGTTFYVFLPIVEGNHVKTTNLMPSLAEGKLRGETILLVEDEEAVRIVAGKVLRQYGFRVIEAHDGEKALEICLNFTDPIHVLITDVVMPGISGPQLVADAIKSHPEMNVIFMSGYPDDESDWLDADASKMIFLEKPFTPDTLLRKISLVLEEKAP